MEVNYKRENDRNYLVLKPSQIRDYQEIMVTENTIKGLLPVNCRCWNGEEDFYYDITSRQTLTNLFEKKEMELSDVKNFFYSLESLSEELNQYFMDFRSVLFHPDFCFKKPGENFVEWIFYPTEEENYLPIAEFFLRKVNHKDNVAMELVYQFYSSVKEGFFCLSDFLTQLHEMKSESEPVANASEEDGLNWISESPKTSFGLTEERRELAMNKPEEKFWNKFLSRFLKQREIHVCTDPIVEQRYWGRRTEHYETEREEDGKFETVMWNQNSRIQGVLKYMTGRSRGKEYRIETFPFVIGKMQESVDLCLNYKSVSRIHARISKEEEHFFIEDLNSLNGTFVNGFRLNIAEKTELHPGDEVSIADIVFVFE